MVACDGEVYLILAKPIAVKNMASKYWGPVVFSSFALAFLSPLATADTPEQVFAQASPSVVVVVVVGTKGEPIGLGSGVVTGVGRVITNCHVAQKGESLQVHHSGKVVKATLQYADPDRDLCQLSAPDLQAPPVLLGSTKHLRVGQRVYAIGAPQGLELTLSEGIISSLRQYEGSQYIQTSAAISPGSSGGGLFDDQGRLIGITAFYFVEGQNLNFALPVDWIVELPNRSQTAPRVANQRNLDWLNRASVLWGKEDWQGLLALSQQWIKSEPENVVALHTLSIAYNSLGQYDLAIKSFREVLRIRPEDTSAWNGLGAAYVNLKQYEHAIKAFREALRIEPEYAKAWFNLGVAYGDLMQFHQAIQAYRESVRIEPEYADAWYNLGNVYLKLKQYDQAIKAYRETLRSQPKNADAWYTLGNTYAILGQYDQAIQAYQGALNILPEDAKSWRNLGLAYHHQGQRNKVREIYQTLRKLDPAMADEYFNELILP